MTTKRIAKLLRSNLLGLVAIFIALGGVAWASVNAPKNSVGTRALKPGAVQNSDIGAGAVTEDKVAANALGTASINEGALGRVPSATRALDADHADAAAQADNAAKLGGSSPAAFLPSSQVKRIEFRPPVLSTCDDASPLPAACQADVLVAAGFTLHATCSHGAGLNTGHVKLTATAVPAQSTINYGYILGNAQPVHSGLPGTGTIADVTTGPGSAVGTIILQAPNSVTSVDFHLFVEQTSATDTRCEVFGTALSA